MLLTYSLTPYKNTILDKIGHIVRTTDSTHVLQARKENAELQKQLILSAVEAVISNGFEEALVESELYLSSLEIVEHMSDTSSNDARTRVAEHIRDSLLHLIVGMETLFKTLQRDVVHYDRLESLDIHRGTLHVFVR